MASVQYNYGEKCACVVECVTFACHGHIIIIIILFISYIIVQQQDVVSKKHQKYKTWCGLQFNYMVVKYITMSLASHWFIVLQVIVLSRIIIHSAIMLALMSSSVFILLLYHLVMSLLTATYVPRHIFGGMVYNDAADDIVVSLSALFN